MTPMFLFSGIFFPIDTLPSLVATVAFFTPLYHLVNVCRFAAFGHPQSCLWDIAWLVFVAMLLVPYPFRLMRRRLIQ
jgi:lipooligosaccharide transport system permease protein